MRWITLLLLVPFLLGMRCEISDEDFMIRLVGGEVEAGPMLWEGSPILGAEFEFTSSIGRFFFHQVNAIIPEWSLEPEHDRCWEVLDREPGSSPADGVWTGYDGARIEAHGSVWPTFWSYVLRDRLRYLNGHTVSWGTVTVRLKEEVPGCLEDPGPAVFHPWIFVWYEAREGPGETTHACNWGFHRRGDNPSTRCDLPGFENFFKTRGSHVTVWPPAE